MPRFMSEKQRKALIRFVRQNPKLIGSRFDSHFTFKDAQMLWEKLTEELNSMPGGCVKGWKSWRKCWHDLYSRTKKARPKIALPHKTPEVIENGINVSTTDIQPKPETVFVSVNNIEEDETPHLIYEIPTHVPAEPENKIINNSNVIQQTVHIKKNVQEKTTLELYYQKKIELMERRIIVEERKASALERLAEAHERIACAAEHIAYPLDSDQ